MGSEGINMQHPSGALPLLCGCAFTSSTSSTCMFTVHVNALMRCVYEGDTLFFCVRTFSRMDGM